MTKISLPFEDHIVYHEHYPARGYLSSMGYKIVLGVGEAQKVPKMVIEWPDRTTSIFDNLEVNKEYEIGYDKVHKSKNNISKPQNIYTEKTHL